MRATGKRATPPSWARLLHAGLLRAYPARVRQRFGPELRADFAAAWAGCRAPGATAYLRLWLRTVKDVSLNAVRFRFREPIHSNRSAAPGTRKLSDKSVNRPTPLDSQLPGKRDFMSQTIRDLRLGLRALRSTPLFTATVVLTLALGIGTNTAIFSVVDGVVLQALPYPDPDRLVRVWTEFPDTGQSEFAVSNAEFLDYRGETEVVELLAASTRFDAIVGGTDGPERLRVGASTASFWEAFAPEIALGRAYGPEEDRPGFDRVAVLSHEFWQTRLGGDPSVLGTTIRVNDTPLEIVGVTAAGFRPPGADVVLWTPLALDPESVTSRSGHYLDVVGRLAPGATLAEQRAEADAIVARWIEEYEHAHPFQIVPLREQILGDADDALLLLLASVGLVLLIACANVAGMMLARSEDRQRELGIRKALGAGPGRLMRQMLTENLLLAVIAGLLGLGAAAWGTRLLLALEPGDLPRIGSVGIDSGVLAFAAGLSIATGLLFGLLPAARAARRPVLDALRPSGGRSAAMAGGGRTQRALVVAEVALAVVLVAGAGLLLRSFARLMATDPGLDADSLVTARIGLPSSRYEDSPALVGFYDRLQAELNAIPGVERASMVRRLPVLEPPNQENFVREEEADAPDEVLRAFDYQITAPGYFLTAGIPLAAGRDFDDRDRDGFQRVAIINRAVARTHFAGEDPLGRRIRILAADNSESPFEIVGVANDVRHNGLGAETPTQIFVPYTQAAYYTPWASREFALVLRTTGDAAETLARVRRAVRSLDPELALSDATTMTAVISRSLARPRFLTLLAAVFSVLALLLAAVGTYGVVSYGVNRRIQEFGLRMALGARPVDILTFVLRRGMIPVATGLVVGLMAALALTRWASSILYQTEPSDPLVHGITLTTLAVVGALAVWIPARRAVTVDPLIALRDG